jgi:hypothetical protein
MWLPFSPASSPAFVVLCFLDDWQPDWDAMDSHCRLTCISFMAKDAEHFFMCLLAILISLRTVQFICPIIK